MYLITLAKIMAQEKIVAPKRLPKGIIAVYSELLLPAMIAVRTSGAPLAKARKVTPASV